MSTTLNVGFSCASLSLDDILALRPHSWDRPYVEHANPISARPLPETSTLFQSKGWVSDSVICSGPGVCRSSSGVRLAVTVTSAACHECPFLKKPPMSGLKWPKERLPCLCDMKLENSPDHTGFQVSILQPGLNLRSGTAIGSVAGSGVVLPESETVAEFPWISRLTCIMLIFQRHRDS